MSRVALICEYDGTDFVGFQTQKNGRSVQETLEKSLSVLFEKEIKITGCSRTDSGVHARGHVSSCDVPFYIPKDKLPFAINALLPKDLSVRKAIYTDDDFSARFCTLGKRYIYRIYVSTTPSPLLMRYSAHVNRMPDIKRMSEAAELFAGEHDFSAFCAVGGDQKSTVRRINSVTVDFAEGFSKSDAYGQMIEIEVRGEAFLYNMVRIISGTLLEIGTGRLSKEDLVKALNIGDRKMAGKTLPANGLTLEEVFYDWDKHRAESVDKSN